jgi:hypothetical protein
MKTHPQSEHVKTAVALSGDARRIDGVLAISEAASKKRGRPRVMSEWFRNSVAFDLYHPGIKTERGRQNVKYLYRAIDALDIAPCGTGLAEFGWLVDWAAADAGNKGAIKAGILTELGRMEGHAVEAARALAGMQPLTVKQAAAFLRGWRLKASSRREDHDEWLASRRNDGVLLRRLAAVLDQYQAEHPSVTVGELRAVVDALDDMLRRAEPEPE